VHFPISEVPLYPPYRLALWKLPVLQPRGGPADSVGAQDSVGVQHPVGVQGTMADVTEDVERFAAAVGTQDLKRCVIAAVGGDDGQPVLPDAEIAPFDVIICVTSPGTIGSGRGTAGECAFRIPGGDGREGLRGEVVEAALEEEARRLQLHAQASGDPV